MKTVLVLIPYTTAEGGMAFRDYQFQVSEGCSRLEINGELYAASGTNSQGIEVWTQCYQPPSNIQLH